MCNIYYSHWDSTCDIMYICICILIISFSCHCEFLKVKYRNQNELIINLPVCTTMGTITVL